jgi:hypothetical protein
MGNKQNCGCLTVFTSAMTTAAIYFQTGTNDFEEEEMHPVGLMSEKEIAEMLEEDPDRDSYVDMTI